MYIQNEISKEKKIIFLYFIFLQNLLTSLDN